MIPIPKMFSETVRDCFVQWYGSLNRRQVLAECKLFKGFFSYDYYSNHLPFDTRFHLTRLRISANSIKIYTVRYEINHIPWNERYCASRDIEESYHFVLICPLYNNKIRKRYIEASLSRISSV